MEVNPYHKPESLLKLNPRGLVPTLQYDNKPLYESTVVCEFLEDAYPDHGPKLLPSDPYARAKLRIWTDFITSRVIPSFHRVRFCGPFDRGVPRMTANTILAIPTRAILKFHREGPLGVRRISQRIRRRDERGRTVLLGRGAIIDRFRYGPMGGKIVGV